MPTTRKPVTLTVEQVDRLLDILDAINGMTEMPSWEEREEFADSVKDASFPED